MKKFFTNLKAKRLMVSASLIAVFSLPASAGETWYAYHAQVEAYPTGAGQVYISTESGVPESERQYSERQTKEIVSKYGTLYVYPKANEGWQCIGVTTDELNENEEWVYVESLSSIVYPDQEYITVNMPNGIHTKTIDPVTGTEQDDDSATTATLMPLDPNNSFKTIFTHVAVDEFDDQDALGSTTISKLANDIGDKVTLTATPNDERCHFVKWTLDGKDVSTEASIDVDVTGVATYLAHFTADSAEVLHFAEEGEYKMWYSPDTRISIPSNVNYFFLYADSVQKEGDEIVAKPSPYRYSVSPGTPTILYGKGDAQIVKTPASPYGLGDNLFAYSGADGVKIDTLDVEKKYYTFDTNAVVFNQVSGTIAPNTVYVGIPDSVFTNAGKEVPATIPLKNLSSIATGIAAPVAKPVAIRKGIYTIDGRRVDAMEQKGVYIYDGKKVLYRKGK